jgi:hypothetical protein
MRFAHKVIMCVKIFLKLFDNTALFTTNLTNSVATLYNKTSKGQFHDWDSMADLTKALVFVN